MGITGHKKVMMLVAKIFFLFLIILSCDNEPCLVEKEKTGGSYTVKITESNSGRTVISGQFVNENNSGIPLNPIINGVILEAKKRGRFLTYVHPGKYNISGVFIGYKWICTKKINVQEGDSVYITLQLEEDDQPLNN